MICSSQSVRVFALHNKEKPKKDKKKKKKKKPKAEENQEEGGEGSFELEPVHELSPPTDQSSTQFRNARSVTFSIISWLSSSKLLLLLPHPNPTQIYIYIYAHGLMVIRILDWVEVRVQIQSLVSSTQRIGKKDRNWWFGPPPMVACVDHVRSALGLSLHLM